MKATIWVGPLFALATSLAALSPADATVPIVDDVRAARARDAIVELDVRAAREALDGADDASPDIATARALLAIYEGDYDRAAAILARPDLAGTREGAELLGIARGSARATAGSLWVRDDERGVAIRVQDDEDRVLVPMLADVAVRARELLAKELGVELPRPLLIELVRDQFTLAAMTGLPEDAAQTTGTVAVAKWGRVTMLSPRATTRGYPWLDTLVHEMTHLALTRGTRDRAPLWLQEGVAKRQETRWREPEPHDDRPSSDTVAALGIERGLGVAIDKMGPSIAMLPSAEQASIAFAEVSSFIRYWAREAGDDALPQLVLRLAKADDPDDLDRAITEVSGADFATWDRRWRAYLNGAPRDLPPDQLPGAMPPNGHEIARRYRLGELLSARGHHHEAAIELSRAQALAPDEASLRCALAASLLAYGRRESALPLVEDPAEVHDRVGRFFSLHGLLHPDAPDPDRAFRLAIALDPLAPPVACEEKAAPERPIDPLRAALCDAARRRPGADRR
jgi:tetratricopeptide (TPR) repeat protein